MKSRFTAYEIFEIAVILTAAIFMIILSARIVSTEYHRNNPRLSDLEIVDYDHGSKGTSQTGYSKIDGKKYVVTFDSDTDKPILTESKDTDGKPIYYNKSKQPTK